MSNTTAVVITPTTGDPKLLDAIESVHKQTHKNVRHVVVVDGPQFEDDLNRLDLYGTKGIDPKTVDVCILPENTHMGAFYGHRVYAGFAHLVNEEYVFLLDQDNWYEPDHIESMIDVMETNKLDWAYSLRNIIGKNGNFLCQDNCESLGKWPVWTSYFNQENEFINYNYHVDTSTYGFKNSFFKLVAHNWHGGYGQDRKFLTSITTKGVLDLNGPRNVQYDTNRKYTVNYRLDGNPNSASPDFFLQGNKIMEMKYKGQEYPWVQKTPVI